MSKTKITKEYLRKNLWKQYDGFVEWYLIIPGIASPIKLELNIEEESAFIDNNVIQMDNTRSLEQLVKILDGKDV